jgi:hypothetical protein
MTHLGHQSFYAPFDEKVMSITKILTIYVDLGSLVMIYRANLPRRFSFDTDIGRLLDLDWLL